MPETKIIANHVTGCEVKRIGDFIPLQGGLKEIGPENLKRLKKSITDNGFTAPLFVWQGYILDGHQRKIALEELRDEGWTIPDVPFVEIEAPDIQTAKRILLTYVSQYGDIVAHGLETYLEEIGLSAIDALEFTNLPLEHLIAKQTDGDDEEIEITENPKSKAGELYELGEHRLLCGDATNPGDVEKLMNGERASMTWTDPPYNVDYQGGMNADGTKSNREGILNDKMDKGDFYEFLLKAMTNILSVTDGAVYVCMSSTELTNLQKAFLDAGGHFQSFIIWVKNTFTLSRSDWQSQYEPILYGWPEGREHYFAGFRDEGNVWQNVELLKPSHEDGKTIIKLGEYHLKLDGIVTGEVCKKNDCVDIWMEKKPTRSAEHPTSKPIKLVGKAIGASSKRGDIVLDLFAGGGSAIIASEELKRRCFSMELDPRFIDAILNRWAKQTGKDPIRASDKMPWSKIKQFND